MPKGTNQKLKLYRLAQIMLEQTDDEHYITMAEIMEALRRYDITADRKSLYNDLRDHCPLLEFRRLRVSLSAIVTIIMWSADHLTAGTEAACRCHSII